ncbi:MAG: MarR family winged helix-turn-helix transcriptional regulator [Burkholderiales bacterium]
MTKEKPAAGQGHAWALLLTAHAVLIERIETALGDAELPPLAWYDVLWALEKAKDGRLRMHELAARIVLSRSNLTRLADRLEAAKLIRREDCADDRRGYFIVITEPGKQMRRKMWPVYRDQIEELFARHISAAETRTIAACLERVLEAVRKEV